MTIAKSALAAAALLALTAEADAGAKYGYGLRIDTAGRWANASLGDARNSSDSVQYAGCSNWATISSQGASCEVRDATGRSIYLWTSDPEIAQVAGSLPNDGYLYVQWDASNQITYLYVMHSSLTSLRQP